MNEWLRGRIVFIVTELIQYSEGMEIKQTLKVDICRICLDIKNLNMLSLG